MQSSSEHSRRHFLSAISAASLAVASGSKIGAKPNGAKIPIGLELYSVRHELEKDPMGTLDRVAQAGYECVEFYAPYMDWTPAYAKEVRQRLDKNGLRCYSTHNGNKSFTGDGLDKAIELNKILGAHYIVLAHPGEITTIDQWKNIADMLNKSNDRMKAAGLNAGYHNHDLEWKPVGGQKPLEVIASNTDKSIMLQLDVGTCVETGNDPVAWINSNPGRIRSLHLKDWSPSQGYKVLFGEGTTPWKAIFQAAEDKGGAEFYLIEQEGSRFPEFETIDRCLVAYRDLRSGSKANS